APPVDPVRYKAAISAIRAGRVPHPADLPIKHGNLEGVVKLEKLLRDPWSTSDPTGKELTETFYTLLADKLEAMGDPEVAQVVDLNGLIQDVMNTRGLDGSPLFLNKGTA